MFLFNESSQITFLLQLFHRGAEGRVPVCFNATIKLEGNVITMSIEVNTSGNNKRDGLSPDFITFLRHYIAQNENQ